MLRDAADSFGPRSAVFAKDLAHLSPFRDMDDGLAIDTVPVASGRAGRIAEYMSHVAVALAAAHLGSEHSVAGGLNKRECVVINFLPEAWPAAA